MSHIAQRTLPDGTVATITADRLYPGALQLEIDGTPQSHVNLQRPKELAFEYMQRIANIIDAYAKPGSPITALHLGGGAFTIPRYIAASRPGSAQQVIELNGELVDFVREYMPLPRREQIRIRRGDARAVAARMPAGLHGKVDVCVVDVFQGARTPAHLTTLEFYQVLLPLLQPAGIVIVNSAGGTSDGFLRREIATLQGLFKDVIAVAEPQVLKGKRYGNTVLMASNITDTSWRELQRIMRSGPYPASMLAGAELKKFTAGAKPITDAAAIPSPAPPPGFFA